MRLFYGPSDWLETHTNARERRAFAAWMMIMTIVSVPITYIWKDTVWMVWALSEVALIAGFGSWTSAETTVEQEDETTDVD